MDRANSFIGSATSSLVAESSMAAVSSDLENLANVVVVVDPFSTGAHLAAEVCRSGYKCCRVFSSWDSPVAALVQQGINIDYCATVQHNNTKKDLEVAIEETTRTLLDLPFNIVAVLPGAETGVELADQLSWRLRLRSNGIQQSLARRNKFHMGETVRQAGVRAVRQCMCHTIEEMKYFFATELFPAGEDRGPFKCVVKPVESAGTDDVFLCQTLEEAETAFNRILGKVNGLGLLNEVVLVQEFLAGQEYVIDKVSRDGVHKLVAVWKYDKRSVNKANFVYFGMSLMPTDSEEIQALVAYADRILDAVGIQQGPSHMEIMLTWVTSSEGKRVPDPCLVEVGARCHGGEGTWLPLTVECIGYNQVSVTLDAYLSGTLFNSLPKDSYALKRSAREVDMVSRHGGIVRALPGENIIRELPSFRSINWEVKPGDYCAVTVDCFTRPGCVQLVNDSEDACQRDLETIHDLEMMGLIDYSVICPKPPAVGAVVVVDPFSSGANLAAMVLQWGYKLILVFSEMDSPVAKLVSKGTNVKPTLMVQHDNNHPNQDFAIAQTLSAIDQEGSPILAILPGAETGVELSDRLAARYGTRSNGEEFTEARRNKYLMQEVVRAKGLRAITQKLCRSETEVLDFLGELQQQQSKDDWKCVIKPNESAGTDSVFLCTSQEEALKAFHLIHNQLNGLGQRNDGALCQEFLRGSEFVIDGVSRDGVYKVVAIWQYDKRSVNGANFVYFGMHLRDGQVPDPEIAALLKYARSVVSALSIHHGPSHMEVMSCVSADGAFNPCLVEVGSRCHGGEGSWCPVATECVGYTQLDVTLNCYIRPDRFDAIPFEPRLQSAGCEAFLVAHEEGVLKDIPGIQQIRSLGSFRRLEMMTQPGAILRPTIDCFTRPGSVQLVNKSNEALLADYNTIRGLELHGLFQLL